MLTRIEYYIIRSKPVQAIIRWLKNIVLPGFEGVSLYHSLNFFRKQIFSNRFTNRANAVSFSFLMALPSLLLFFFSLIPHLPLPEKQILKVIDDMLTLLSPDQEIHHAVSTVIRDFIHHKKTVLLSFSILLTMYFSSNGMMGLMDNFESQLPGFGTRGALAQRGIAILLTLMLILVVLLTLIVMMLQSWIIS